MSNPYCMSLFECQIDPHSKQWFQNHFCAENYVECNYRQLSYQQIAYALWELLDDISTFGDMYKPEINPYFEAVSRQCEKRHRYLSSDGYELFPVVQIKDEE